MTYSINLETTPYEAFKAIYDLDYGFVGTENYLGIAYFWPHPFAHYMRDASISKAKRVHKKLIDQGIPVGQQLNRDNINDEQVLKAYCYVIMSVLRCDHHLHWENFFSGPKSHLHGGAE